MGLVFFVFLGEVEPFVVVVLGGVGMDFLVFLVEVEGDLGVARLDLERAEGGFWAVLVVCCVIG